MLVRASSTRVCEELRALIERQCWPVDYACLVARAVLPSEHASHIDGGVARWLALVLASAATCGPVTETAVQAALAGALVMAALDVFDDVEDGEVAPGADPAVQVNVATGLLLLFHQVCNHPCLRALPASGIQVVTEAALRACGGQHRDLRLRTDGAELCPEEAIAITSVKSAGLVAALCRLGALAGGCKGLLLARYAAFGYHVGMALQLANDLAAARDPSPAKTDLARHRPTLPLVYAACSTGDAATLEPQPAPEGALMATWVVFQAHRLRALRVLDVIERTQPARTLLESFLP